MDVATRLREFSRLEKKRAERGLTPAELRRWVALKGMLNRSFSPGIGKARANERASVRVPTRLGASFETVGEICRSLMTNLSRGGGSSSAPRISSTSAPASSSASTSMSWARTSGFASRSSPTASGRASEPTNTAWACASSTWTRPRRSRSTSSTRGASTSCPNRKTADFRARPSTLGPTREGGGP